MLSQSADDGCSSGIRRYDQGGWLRSRDEQLPESESRGVVQRLKARVASVHLDRKRMGTGMGLSKIIPCRAAGALDRRVYERERSQGFLTRRDGGLSVGDPVEGDVPVPAQGEMIKNLRCAAVLIRGDTIHPRLKVVGGGIDDWIIRHELFEVIGRKNLSQNDAVNMMPARLCDNVVKRSEWREVEEAARFIEALLETGQKALIRQQQIAAIIGEEEFEMVIRMALADRRRKNNSFRAEVAHFFRDLEHALAGCDFNTADSAKSA